MVDENRCSKECLATSLIIPQTGQFYSQKGMRRAFGRQEAIPLPPKFLCPLKGDSLLA